MRIKNRKRARRSIQSYFRSYRAGRRSVCYSTYKFRFNSWMGIWNDEQTVHTKMHAANGDYYELYYGNSDLK